MTVLDLVDRALDINAANLRLGNETFEAAGATFVRNRDAPDIYDANHVADIRIGTNDEMAVLLSRTAEEFAGFGHRRFHTDHRTYPPLIARLRLENYERNEGLVMLLEGSLNGTAPEHRILPVQTDDYWSTYETLKLEDWRESREKEGKPEDLDVARSMARIERAKCPPVRYFLAFVDGQPAGYFNAWGGVDGVGQVENLFTLPRFRNQGVATALIHRCVAESRMAGARNVVIVADPSDTPMHIYSRLGFRPVAVAASYVKRLTDS